MTFKNSNIPGTAAAFMARPVRKIDSDPDFENRGQTPFLRRISLRRQTEAILLILEGHGNRLRRGAVVTAEPGRLRVRYQERAENGV